MIIAMTFAGLINMAMLVMAASVFFKSGLTHVDSIEGAHRTLVPVLGERTAFPWSALLVVSILVVPLFDTGFVLVLRRLAGRSATRGGTDHVSHRLVSLGFSERSAVRILYIVGLAGGGTAWGLSVGGVEQMLPLGALFAVVMTLIGIYLARVSAGEMRNERRVTRLSR